MTTKRDALSQELQRRENLSGGSATLPHLNNAQGWRPMLQQLINWLLFSSVILAAVILFHVPYFIG